MIMIMIMVMVMVIIISSQVKRRLSARPPSGGDGTRRIPFRLTLTHIHPLLPSSLTVSSSSS
jgi:hypothetical protein